MARFGIPHGTKECGCWRRAPPGEALMVWRKGQVRRIAVAARMRLVGGSPFLVTVRTTRGSEIR